MKMGRTSKILLLGLAVLVVASALYIITLRDDREVVDEDPIEEIQEDVSPQVIGTSVLGREILSYSFGSGDSKVLFVGGIHGGYEWNSVLLSYELIDYLKANENAIPEGVSVDVIPSLNPDGLYKVVGVEGRFSREDAVGIEETSQGRFNANNVDLNRNFDCKWQPESTWRGQKVSAGTSAFSEPEAQALRDHVLAVDPEAVIFFHSKAGAVYASECLSGVLPETIDIMNAYSNASGYRAVETFDAYPITGDAEGWLASIGIPAITVEMTTRENTEWTQNLSGVEALLEYYAR